MKIPNDAVERQILYADLIEKCSSSRSERFEFYKQLRNYFLFGTIDDSGAPYNKIESTLDTLTSFIYSPEGLRFSLALGTSADESDVLKADPLSRELAEQWRNGGTHMRFGLAVLWAHVFGCMLLKVQWRKRTKTARTYLVEPHQFGVLREDIVDLADQEAYCMWYSTTKSQLDSDLEGNPRRKDIMARVLAGPPASGGSGISQGMSRLLLSNPVGGIPGSVATQYGTAGGTLAGGLAGNRSSYNYSPQVDADLVEMCDLYVWNDEAGDYQVVTQAAGDVTIFDRPQSRVGVKGMPHFVPVRVSNKLYDFFWGDSYVSRLAWLQDWRTEDIGNIRNLQNKQSDPPKSVTGAGGIAEEKLAALRRAGGLVSLNSPTAKIETHAPKMPENVFASLDQIDRMFDDVAGIGHILQGKGESGVRSRGQADLMARLGSSRPKQRALVVEEAAEEVATLILRCVQEESDQRFTAVDPLTQNKSVFTANQFTTDFEAKVDAHSSSPIFIEDRKTDAEHMLEAHVIDRETFLDLYDPPNLQMLKRRLKVIEHKEAQAQQAQAQAEAKGKAKAD